MAAFDCFLDLDPVQELLTGPAVRQEAHIPAAASADAAAPGAVWAWKRQQQLKPAIAAQQVDASFSDELSACTSSPGCSYTGPAALEASMLDLADDACSAPPQLAARHAQEHSVAAAAAAGPLQVLPDGTPLVAATFFEDLAAKGSLYQYCLQR